MISLLKLLHEIEIKNKDPYAYGTQHNIYKSLNNNDRIFKVVNPDFEDVPEQTYDWIKIFKAHPDLFPKVFRSNDRGAEVEKLDVAGANKDFTEVESFLNAKFGKTSFKELLFDIVENESDYKQRINDYGQYLVKEDQKLALIFKKFISLMIKLQPINLPDDSIDIHQGNFGYDKSGKLKMIDI